LTILDWDGVEKWTWGNQAPVGHWGHDDYGNPIARGHHDFQRDDHSVGYYVPGDENSILQLEAGRTLILSQEEVVKPEVSVFPLRDDVILEVANDTKAILWQWHAADPPRDPGTHPLDPYGFDESDKAVISVSRVPGGEVGTTDWMHINSVSYVGENDWCDDDVYEDPPETCVDGDDACEMCRKYHPKNIITDGRQGCITWIINRTSGRIVWKVGPYYEPPHLEARLGDIIGQHHAHMIPKTLPGEGNILLFDNGGVAGYDALLGLVPTWQAKQRFYSRVIEFDPETLEIVWEYERILPDFGETYTFFSTIISSAQRLPNGNTLITEGNTGRIFEVTGSGELVWEYISGFDDDPLEGPPGAEYVVGPRAVYRAYRVPCEFIPGGCE
jgi:hypothetical protein